MTITLKDFEELCASLFKQRTQVQELQHAADEAKAVQMKIQAQVMACMDEHGKDQHRVAGHGLLYLVNKFRVTTPKTVEEKKALFEFLGEQGTFYEYASVNSNTLNSLYDAEFEKAKTRGDVDFKLPGVGDPVLVRTMSFRKE